MLGLLGKALLDGTLRVSHVYVGHVKKDEDQKVLTHADAYPWEDASPVVKSVVQQHLYQVIDSGELGATLFPCQYHGQILPVEKVTTAEYERTRNRPTVEILEAIRDLTDEQPEAMVELANTLAYKVLAASTIKNHLVAIARFHIVPQLGAQPIRFTFATVVDLEDREEALLDDNSGQFATRVLNNTIKRAKASRAVLFPCLDDEGQREMADLMVYVRGNQAGWVRAMEVPLRFSPEREGKILLRLITQQAGDHEVHHDLFTNLASNLVTYAGTGLPAAAVAVSLERALRHGIDREGFVARWADAFGTVYRPAYESLFVGPEGYAGPVLKMDAGEVQVSMTPGKLQHFRQVTIQDRTYIAFEVPHRADPGWHRPGPAGQAGRPQRNRPVASGSRITT